ncbi:MAG: glycosyltransferase [Rhodococcus sp. (in: high G+C Gram-positive bacteria)]|nr:MAG: glycosyltransferase [Rhodococcus sp. (in: high G+C Gram-positive bacteria)]
MPRAERSTVGLVPFEVTTIERATAQVLTEVRNRRPTPIRLANAYCVALASKDRKYRDLMNSSGINFPDGTPVVWFMRMDRSLSSQPGRVRGPSLFNEILDKGRNEGVRHFFLGTTNETLEILASKLTTRYPGLEISGTYAPPFGQLDGKFLADCQNQVSQTEANVVWVALGTPKQDFAAAKLAPILGMPTIGIGAAFDFAAGTTREAPAIVQRVGLEWAFRLLSEPKRLWRRYLFGNLIFIRAASRSHRAAR